MAIKRHEVVFLDDTSPQFVMPSAATVDFQFQNDLIPQATIFLNGQAFIVAEVSGEFVFDPGGPNERIFDQIGQFLQIEVSAQTFQIFYQGNRDEEFYVSDGLWSVGRYSQEPSPPEELVSALPTSGVWTLTKP